MERSPNTKPWKGDRSANIPITLNSRGIISHNATTVRISLRDAALQPLRGSVDRLPGMTAGEPSTHG